MSLEMLGFTFICLMVFSMFGMGGDDHYTYTDY